MRSAPAQELISIGRIEGVKSAGSAVLVVLSLLSENDLPRRFANPRAIAACVDDVSRTPLRVRAVRIDKDRLNITLTGVPAKARRIRIRIEGLVPGRDEVVVALDREELTFDPASAAPLVPAPAEPLTSYLFKDFASFKRLMLDTIAQDAPSFTERHEADEGIAIVDVMAFAADHLSYFQDGVATEAYLETARRRVSVRRHARLTGYVVHEGCAPRLWLQVVPREPFVLPRGFRAIAAARGAQESRIYETLVDAALYPSLRRMTLWDFGSASFTLAHGATAATIVRSQERDRLFAPLTKGTVLIFNQHYLPGGRRAPARLRQAVRLVSDAENFAHPTRSDRIISRITWHADDALAFDFPAHANDGHANHVNVILGNIVPADYGETQPPASPRRFDRDGELLVHEPSLTYAVPYDPEEPAAAFATTRPYRAVPQITIVSELEGSPPALWSPRADLIGADPYKRAFTCEPDGTGSLLIRFGDGVNGWRPDRASTFVVTTRRGNGLAGRIGPDALTDYDWGADLPIRSIGNPLPSVGGADAMGIDVVRRQAPALVHEQHRCVTDDDYVALAQEMPGVTAAVQRTWTGSGETINLYVHAGLNDARTRRDVEAAVDRGRMIGAQVAVRKPRCVGVFVELGVRVTEGAKENAVAGAVVAAVKAAYEARNVAMGTPVFASWFVSAAALVRGVANVQVRRFERLQGDDARGAGVITFAPTELAVLVDQAGMTTDGRAIVVIE